jgi:hypothetical protein
MGKKPGLSLLDIFPAHELVKIDDERSIKIYGLGAKSVFILLQRFPHLGAMLKGGNINWQQFIQEAPDAVAAILAAALGRSGDEEVEEAVSLYGVEIQVDILAAVMRLTFKNGFGPFVDRIVQLTRGAASENSGRVMDTKSAPVLKPSLPPDTLPALPSTTPLE